VPVEPSRCPCWMKAPDDGGAWPVRRRRVFLLRRANFKSVYRARDKQASAVDTVTQSNAAAAAADEFDMDQKSVFSITQPSQQK